MQFRHEWKHEINSLDRMALRARLGAVMTVDPHAVNGYYAIRSLYFDNVRDKALLEKLDGVNCREKFRLRHYNGDTSFLLLEKKSKINGLCSKDQVRLTVEETEAILQGDPAALAGVDKPLVQELRRKMAGEGLRPKTIVDYTREPFIYPPGNVRVTMDYQIRTGLSSTDFLNPDCVTVPVPDDPIILEVKWDGFLPCVIRDLVQLEGRHTSAFSKYAACRMYG